jgi:NTP pyrophosphatase (non-canonical NTP hydrolase)
MGKIAIDIVLAGLSLGVEVFKLKNLKGASSEKKREAVKSILSHLNEELTELREIIKLSELEEGKKDSILKKLERFQGLVHSIESFLQ